MRLHSTGKSSSCFLTSVWIFLLWCWELFPNVVSAELIHSPGLRFFFVFFFCLFVCLFFSAQLQVAKSDFCGLCISHAAFNCLCCHFFSLFLFLFFFFYDYRDSSNNTSLSLVIMRRSQLQNFVDSTTEKKWAPCNVGSIISLLLNR